ncbi:MAG: hypothetical protein M1814_003598 [Vezdaea aestivalis]|nr:MAG: hypothetical protein M1814_003598 [Vezdaea aestivalis]
MSPRRSSRARTTQPATDNAQPNPSSTSSNSSSRTERNTRSQNKTQSPHKSNTSRSRSSADNDDNTAQQPAGGEPPSQSESSLARQSKRAFSEDADGPIDILPDADEELEDAEEEVTRCICGNLDYPGPPVPVAIPVESVDARPGPNADPDDSLATTEPLPEEAGSLFIQCDTCKVWQHGGCVGIMDETISPDEYYCEECRKDLHRLAVGMNGQRYSKYLPVTGSSEKTSRLSSPSNDTDQKSSKDKASRAAALAQLTKRRSTMNSRDAAYDEEELLRRAIEESKTLDPTGSINGDMLTRRAKRARSDSEDGTSIKRQRTFSESPTPTNTRLQSQAIDTDEETTATRPNGTKRVRGANLARSQRDRDLREKERERLDAAGRRKGRAERRRGQPNADGPSPISNPLYTPPNTHPDSDPSDDLPLSQTTKRPPPPSEPSPSRPAPSQTPNTHQTDTPPPPTSSHTRKPPSRARRRGARPQARDRTTSPSRSVSRGPGARDDFYNGISNRPSSSAGLLNGHALANGDSLSNSHTTKPSKPKYMHPHRTTMNEMRRRVAAILEFVSKVKGEVVESSSRGSASGGATGAGSPPAGEKAEANAASVQAVSEMLKATVESLPGVNGENGKVMDPDAFKGISTLDMIAVMTRSLTAWQDEFGRLGERS